MFNLIVAVISIALIAAMAAASIFYGGAAFGSGTAQAQASTLVNNGQQVSGAQQLYMIDNSGNRANDIDVLTPTYLQALPTAPANATGLTTTDVGAWEISADGSFAYIPLNADNGGANTSPAATVCAELVSQGAAANVTLAGTLTAASTLGAGGLVLGDSQFGCVSDLASTISGDADGGSFFIFKL
jgi:ABC-type oligopeptide transport system substrate-binding subunit